MYTRSRNEKKVAEYMANHGFEVYLPLVKTLRQWSDRKKKVELPLIAGYVFVHVNEQEYFHAIKTPGAVKYVTFEGKGVAIPERQIELIRRSIERELVIEATSEKFEPGEAVKIISGPLNGFEGELLTIKQKSILIIRLNHTGFSLKVEINKTDVIKL